MKYCFILLKKRGDYFNLDKLNKEVSSNIRFIAITSSDNISSKFKEELYDCHIVKEVDFLTCKQILSDYQKKYIISEFVIVTGDEILLETCAKLRKIFNANGTTLVQLSAFQNKRFMKEIAIFGGIKTPRFIEFNKSISCQDIKEYYHYLEKMFGQEFIVKPYNGGSSYAIGHIKSSIDLANWYEQYYLEEDQYIIEEYIDGELFLCDSFIYNEEFKFFAINKNVNTCLDYSFGKLLGFYPIPKGKLHIKLKDFNQKILNCLQASDGCYHLEVMIRNDELFFIEIGARPGGNVITHFHEKNYGIQLYELLLRKDLNILKDSHFHIEKNLYNACVVFPKVPGEVKKINTPKIQSNNQIIWNIKVGDYIQNYPTSIIDQGAAEISIYNTNYEVLVSDIKKLQSHKIYD